MIYCGDYRLRLHRVMCFTDGIRRVNKTGIEANDGTQYNVDVIVYGIGAGPELDGQLVISHDILGNFVGEIKPMFVSRYANLDQIVEGAFRAYADDVRSGRFPAPQHCYAIDPAEAASLVA